MNNLSAEELSYNRDIELIGKIIQAQAENAQGNPNKKPEDLKSLGDSLVEFGLLQQDAKTGAYTLSTKRPDPQQKGKANQLMRKLMLETGEGHVYQKKGKLIANEKAENEFQGRLLSIYSRLTIQPQQAPEKVLKQAYYSRPFTPYQEPVRPVKNEAVSTEVPLEEKFDEKGRVALTEPSLRKTLRESGDFIGEKFNAAKQWTNQAVQSAKDFFKTPVTAPVNASTEAGGNSNKAALALIVEDIKKPFKAIASAVSSVTDKTVATVQKGREFMTQAVAAVEPKKMARAFLWTGLTLIGTGIGLLGMTSAKTGNPEPAKADKGPAKTSVVHVAKTVSHTDTTQSVKAASNRHDVAPKNVYTGQHKITTPVARPVIVSPPSETAVTSDTLANTHEDPVTSIFKANVIDAKITPSLLPKSVRDMKAYANEMSKQPDKSFALSYQLSGPGPSQ